MLAFSPQYPQVLFLRVISQWPVTFMHVTGKAFEFVIWTFRILNRKRHLLSLGSLMIVLNERIVAILGFLR